MFCSKLKISIFKLIFLCSVLILFSCQKFSEQVTDEESGLNGSFEVSKNGIPVNWLMYTPNTVPDSSFEIVLDKKVYKEGLQSLKFNIEKCSSVGGYLSPGFTNEFFDREEGSYEVSFWIKNDGAAFRFSAGGVSAMEGNMKVLTDEKTVITNWKNYKYRVDIPKDNFLRVELNILSPGAFWIDDFRINKL